MGDVAYSIRKEPINNIEIVVHVDETLGEERRTDLATSLVGHHGIRSAEFCPLRYHLMLIRYDRDTMTAQDVLGRVKSQNVHAELIGPV